MFTPKIGEDEPILSNIFQTGWNHQLGTRILFLTFLLKKRPSDLLLRLFERSIHALWAYRIHGAEPMDPECQFEREHPLWPYVA